MVTQTCSHVNSWFGARVWLMVSLTPCTSHFINEWFRTWVALSSKLQIHACMHTPNSLTSCEDMKVSMSGPSSLSSTTSTRGGSPISLMVPFWETLVRGLSVYIWNGPGRDPKAKEISYNAYRKTAIITGITSMLMSHSLYLGRWAALKRNLNLRWIRQSQNEFDTASNIHVISPFSLQSLT